MKVQIIANGNTIDAEMTAEQAEKLGLTKKKTGRERAKKRDFYYSIDRYLDVMVITEDNENTDDIIFRGGNYFTDEALAEKMSKCIGLMLRMQRWTDEHNTKRIDWENTTQPKYFIYYDYCGNKLRIDYIYTISRMGIVYFSYKELAKQAIEIFGQEIIEAYVKE